MLAWENPSQSQRGISGSLIPSPITLPWRWTMERIVSLCPSNTEILYLLGLKDRIVGVDDYSDWPKEVNRLPKCGPDLDIDIDKVKSLRPDLVIASLSVPGMEKNIEGLKREGIPHLILAPNR